MKKKKGKKKKDTPPSCPAALPCSPAPLWYPAPWCVFVYVEDDVSRAAAAAGCKPRKSLSCSGTDGEAGAFGSFSLSPRPRLGFAAQLWPLLLRKVLDSPFFRSESGVLAVAPLGAP